MLKPIRLLLEMNDVALFLQLDPDDGPNQGTENLKNVIEVLKNPS